MNVYCKIFLVLLTSASVAQTNNVVTVAEKMPEFPGGNVALAQYIGMNIHYPPMAFESGASGKAYVKFIVDTSGKIQSPEIIKSSGNKELNDEALRVVRGMPNWNPGIDSGRKVNVSINLPIKFGGVVTSDKNPFEKKLSPAEQEKHDKAMRYYYDGHKLDQQGKFDKALEKFDLSLVSEPDNKFALYDKARMHLNMGQKDLACATWNKMKGLNIRPDEVEEALKKNCN